MILEESLRSSFRTYIKKYGYHEQKFYNYRGLLHDKYFALCNSGAEEIVTENGIKKWKFYDKNKFMESYSELREETFRNEKIINNNNGLKSRSLLVKDFVKKLITISHEYIPENYNAIEISGIANEVVSAFADMEAITKKQSNEIESHIKSLKNVNDRIKAFEELKGS